MSTTKLISAEESQRDGTSQLGRPSSALSPAYVAVDERKTEDLVVFVRELAKTLVYHGEDDQPDGDFSDFVGDLSPQIVAAYLLDPSKFDSTQYPALFRPHFALFLAFLRLLQDTQADMNTLTRRHLEFHYQRFLRMQPRESVPDRLNLLFSLAARESNILVPAGTTVSAGADASKKEQLYRTSRDLIVNRASIEKVSSVFVERTLVGIQESWHRHVDDALGGRFEMFRIAYGRPLPGDPLPNFPNAAGATLVRQIDLQTKLESLVKLVRFSKDSLKLNLSKLREAMTLSTAPPPDPSSASAAALVSNRIQKHKGIIDAAALAKNPTYTPPSRAGRTFDEYADAALGPLVIDQYPTIKKIKPYWDALGEIEAYFAMPIERFETLLVKLLLLVEPPPASAANATAPVTWSDAYETNAALVASILEDAYDEKIRAERIAQLAGARTTVFPPPSNAGGLPASGYTAALQLALGLEVNGKGSDVELEDGLRVFLTEPDVKTLSAAAAAARWDEVYALLAHAMAARLGRKPPRKEVWLNIFPAADARNVLSRRGTSGDRAVPFSTFGAPTPSDPHSPPASVLGFALTSPILALAGGARTVTLTLGLNISKYDFDLLVEILQNFGKTDTIEKTEVALSPLAFEISTEKGWLRCPFNCISLNSGNYEALLGLPNGIKPTWSDYPNAYGLQFVLAFPKNTPAITPLPSAPDGMDARFPALRILMQPVWSTREGRFVTYYRELSGLLVGAAHIKVVVAGLVPSALENDESTLDPKKPFEPFGVMPAVGSRLLIGHPEVVTKKIEKIAFNFDWMGAPAKLGEHYKNYGIVDAATELVSFKAAFSSVAETGSTTLVASAPLFLFKTGDPDPLKNKVTIPARSIPDELPAEKIAADEAPVLKGAYGPRVSSWRRYLQWELQSPDFQHRNYPAVAAKKALDFAVASGTRVAADYQVNPPYTPKLKSLTLDYTSSVEITFFCSPTTERRDRAYHVHPFGIAELFAPRISEELPFLPRYDVDSELYIGLRDVSLPESVTLLFQLDEGTADRDIAPPEVTYSQLSGNRFVPLGHKVLSDATRGLQRSGVVELALSEAEPNTILPSSLTWVRVSVPQDMASICDLLALHTQAVEAVFDDQGNSPEHYRAPLPGETIKKLRTPIAGIVGVMQPYQSYGGRMAEDDAWFSTRVSERLRHKQRALSSWDYERIVLAAFPEIFKAKCIPSSASAPGVVEVLVIPDVRALPTNEFGPKAPIALLSAIQEHLTARTPACVDVRARNATYRAARLRLGVRFTTSGNDGYWMGRLNDELNRFLSPWAYEEGADIVIGGKIHASNIVEFVDRRPYVDYVAGITLFYTDDEGTNFTFLRPPGDAGGPYFVDAGGVDHALVAFPKHRIDVLVAEHYDARLYMGISYMELEMDFVVG